MRKRDVKTSTVTSRTWKNTRKCGIEITTDIEHAEIMDAKINNVLWIKAIKKETHATSIVFDILDEKTLMMAGNKMVTNHIVFDVNMDFTCKALFALDR